MIALRDGEIKGFTGLENIAGELFPADHRKQAYRLTKDQTPDSVPFKESAADPLLELILPRGKTKSIFFTGKGGVGKTVVSCATAKFLASQGLRTLLLTTDPAAHIGKVLEREVGDTVRPVEGVPNLWAVQIDQEKAVEEYKRRILEEARGKYSQDMLLAVREELESPCTEEMAAFEKFISYVESEDYSAIVFDTAPTGHTLRLLELPFDYGDQVGLMVATTRQSAGAKEHAQKRYERIITRLKDPLRSVFAFVVYPEYTPVVEAQRAFLDLRDAGITAQFVIANQVLDVSICTNDYFQRRRRMQEKYLREIRERFRLPLGFLPLFEKEIVGLEMVERAASSLYDGHERKDLGFKA